MRLNLGAGDWYADGWTNVDRSGCPHRKDLTADIRRPLPFDPGTVERVYCGHVLEHLPIEDCLQALDHVRDLLAPGGELLVVGPDYRRAQGMVDRGEAQRVLLDEIADGGCRWEGDAHQWVCHAQAVVDLLLKAGFDHVTELPIVDVPQDWPVVSRVGWQCAVLAR